VDLDPDSGTVHRPDRGGDVAAPAGAGHVAAVSHVALSGAEPRRAAGMDLHLRHDAAAGGRVWTRRAGARCRVLRSVVVEGADLAVRRTRPRGADRHALARTLAPAAMMPAG